MSPEQQHQQQGHILANVGVKPEPLLPRSPGSDRPLFIVLMIMVFLACLSAIVSQACYDAAGRWGDDLKQSATVQIKPALGDDGEALAQLAAQIIRARDEVIAAEPLSKARSEDLLRPWLGDVTLPEGLPVPYLIDVTLKRDGALDIAALQASLIAQGIDADIDDHSRWSRDIARTARAVQMVTLTALLLLFAATIGTAGFATQSGLAARKNIVDVLTQVGAQDRYIARLFTARFAWIGLTAGAAGALLAGAIATIFWFFTRRSDSALIPGNSLSNIEYVYVIIAPLIAALVCALAARFTVLRTLQSERRI